MPHNYFDLLDKFKELSTDDNQQTHGAYGMVDKILYVAVVMALLMALVMEFHEAEKQDSARRNQQQEDVLLELPCSFRFAGSTNDQRSCM